MIKNLNLSNLRRQINIIVAVFALLFGLKFLHLSGGDIINSHPFITPDGFDWYTEGIYLVRLLSGVPDLPILPYLRPPGFVFATALDYISGGSGIVISILTALSIFGTYYFVIKIIDLQIDEVNRRWYTIPVAIGTTIYSINYIRVYLLSDSICVFISLAASYFFIKYLQNNKRTDLLVAGLLFLIAGLTQTYGLIPLLLLSGLGCIKYFFDDSKKVISLICCSVSVVFVFLACTYFWRGLMPHINTPSNFDLLKLSFEMFGFYTGVWGYYLFPFLLYFLVSRKVHFRLPTFNNMVGLGSLVIASIFLLFSFVYQWKEARFTYYLFPWLLVAVIVNLKIRVFKNNNIILLSVIMLSTCLITPDNYWSPASSSLKIDPSNDWLVKYIESKPIDRKLNECIKFCEKNDFLLNSDSYVNSVISVYNQIK